MRLSRSCSCRHSGTAGYQIVDPQMPFSFAGVVIWGCRSAKSTLRYGRGRHVFVRNVRSSLNF